MSGYQKITVRVRPFVKADLKVLRRKAGEELLQPLPSQDDLVAALVHAATAAQAAKALRAYWRDSRPWEDEDGPDG